MTKGRIIVYTDQYKKEYNKSPKGYGDWYFSCKDLSGKKYEMNFVGMYKDAKNQAIDFAFNHKSSVLHLLS